MTTRLQSYGRMVEDLSFSGNLSVDADTTTGLTFGYTAGYSVSDAERTAIIAGTILLTDNAVNWVHLTQPPGVAVAVNTGVAPTTSEVLYKVTTVTGAITEILDYRGAIITTKSSFP